MTPPSATAPSARASPSRSRTRSRSPARSTGSACSYIEGGWPGSNPKDAEFFRRIRDVAAGPREGRRVRQHPARRRPPARRTPSIRALVDAETPVVTLVGKSSTLHVERVLETTRDENLRMIGESVGLLQAARPRGDLRRRALLRRLPPRPGVRARDHRGRGRRRRRLARAVRHQRRGAAGGGRRARVARGPRTELRRRRSASTPTTMPGWRWRTRSRPCAPGACRCRARSTATASAAATWIWSRSIATLQLKLGYPVLPPDALRRLTEVSHFVAAVANQHPDPHAPYVGRSAFAHKGGIHVAAIAKVAESYQHIDPAAVGNEHARGGERAGRAAECAAARRGAGAGRRPAAETAVLQRIKELEHQRLPVRGRRGIVRDAGAPRGARLPRALRAGRLHRDRREAGRRQGSGRRPPSSCAWATR